MNNTRERQEAPGSRRVNEERGIVEWFSLPAMMVVRVGLQCSRCCGDVRVMQLLAEELQVDAASLSRVEEL